MFVLFAIFMLSKSILGTSVSIPGVTPVLPLGSDPIILAAATSANDHPSRTTYTIIRTCFLTLFICIWQSTHSNMNAPRDSGIFCLYKKVNHALNTLLAPEMVLFFALRQRFEAKKIADRYNEEFVGNVKDDSLWESIKGWFHAVPSKETGYNYVHPWTTSHGFFVQMGGFMLYEDDYPKRLLDYDDFAEHLRKGFIDRPSISARDLQDRSKGDTISKLIAVVQTGWFILQCLARFIQHLPLSELEVLTLASAVVNGCIYAAWWYKPQGAEVAIRLVLKKSRSVRPGSPPSNQIRNMDEQPRASADAHTNRVLNPDNGVISRPIASNSSVDNNVSRPNLQQLCSRTTDAAMHGVKEQDSYPPTSPHTPIQQSPHAELIERTVRGTFIHIATSAKGWMIQQKFDPDGRMLSVPILFALGKTDPWAMPLTAIVSTAFGSIHFLAWNAKFVTKEAMWQWRSAAVGITIISIWLLSGSIFANLVAGKACSSKGAVGTLLKWYEFALYFSFILCASLRVYVTAVSLRAILDPPPAVLTDIQWSTLIPHL